MILQLSCLFGLLINGFLLGMEGPRLQLQPNDLDIDIGSMQQKHAPLYRKIKDQLAKLRPAFGRQGPIYPAGYTIDREEFVAVLKDATLLSRWLMLHKQDSWLYNNMPNFKKIDVFLTEYDVFFQQRHITQPIKLVCQGDMHGDAHSFINLINYWQEQRYIEKDTLRIIKPELRFCFHGDLVDRGCFGGLIYMLLALLKIANPEQVFSVRGNHEDLRINEAYGFNQELEHLFGNSYRNLQPVIHAFNNTMPFALYIGMPDSDSSKHLKYIRFNHGGISIGFLPNVLLTSDRCKEYECIEKLDIPSWNKCMAEQMNTQYPGYERDKKKLERTLRNNGRIMYLKSLQDLHDVWGDFVIVRKDDGDLEPSVRGEDFFPSVGYETTLGFLKACAVQDDEKEAEFTAEVVAICRAHQHTAEALPLIINNSLDHEGNNGMLRLWLESNDERAQGDTYTKIQKNMVYTFLVCPNTAYSKGGVLFNYNAVGVIDMQSPLENSTIQVVHIPNILLSESASYESAQAGTSN